MNSQFTDEGNRKMKQLTEKATPEEKLQKLAQEFDEFAYIVSHDLKAPVRAINNLAGWIEEDLENCTDPDSRHNLALLRNRADRLDKMITALLLYSRANRTDLELATVNVKELVNSIIKANRQVPDLTFNNQLPDLTLITMEKKLHFVFQQLIDNAIQFGGNSPITVTAANKHDFIEFCLQDKGPGITTEAQPKVFGLFYTVLPKDKGHTTGAGLAIVKKIVEFVGGEIRLHSAPGQGAAFYFTWPKNIQL